MDSVKLSRDQFSDLKSLAIFIYSLSNLNEDCNALSEGSKKKIVADQTAYGVLTINTRWKKPVIVMQYDNFNFFCQNFLEKYNELHQNKPDEDEMYFQLFGKWVGKICEATNWINPVRQLSSVKEEISTKIDVSESNINDIANEKKIEIVKNHVNTFYNLVETKEYKDAWSMLTQKSRASKNWDGDYNKFKNDFDYSRNFNSAKIVSVDEIETNSFITVVEFNCTVSGFSGPFDFVKSLSIFEIDEFVGLVKKVRDLITKRKENLPKGRIELGSVIVRIDPEENYKRLNSFPLIMLKDFFSSNHVWSLNKKLDPDEIFELGLFPNIVDVQGHKKEICLCRFVGKFCQIYKIQQIGN